MKRGKPLFKRWDYYIVRGEVWAEAGMEGWNSGFLCTPCLAERLGRWTDDDFLVVPTRATGSRLNFLARPAYLKSLGVTLDPGSDTDVWVEVPGGLLAKDIDPHIPT
jgi:hypothetical protein